MPGLVKRGSSRTTDVGSGFSRTSDSGAAFSRTLQIARHAIETCELCPRLRSYCVRVGEEKRRAYRNEVYGARPVAGFGDVSARLLIVGLAPAAHGANRTGRVFTGDGAGGSGDFLMAALHRTGFASIPTSQHPDDGLRLTDAFIAEAVRCAPPDNKPTQDEITRCLKHHEAEVAALSCVKVIVALGKIAHDAVLQLYRRRRQPVRPRPGFAHGTIAALPDGTTLIGCYHPSRQNTNTGRLTAAMMTRVFRTARRLAGS